MRAGFGPSSWYSLMVVPGVLPGAVPGRKTRHAEDHPMSRTTGRAMRGPPLEARLPGGQGTGAGLARKLSLRGRRDRLPAAGRAADSAHSVALVERRTRGPRAAFQRRAAPAPHGSPRHATRPARWPRGTRIRHRSSRAGRGCDTRPGPSDRPHGPGPAESRLPWRARHRESPRAPRWSRALSGSGAVSGCWSPLGSRHHRARRISRVMVRGASFSDDSRRQSASSAGSALANADGSRNPEPSNAARIRVARRSSTAAESTAERTVSNAEAPAGKGLGGPYATASTSSKAG